MTLRNEQRGQASKQELVEMLGEAVHNDRAANLIPGLHLQRYSSPLSSVHSRYGPGLCVVTQGSKEVLVGDDRYRYDAAHYLLITVDLPVVSWVLKASREEPFLGLHLDLDMALVRSVAAEAGFLHPVESTQMNAMTTGPLDAGLLDALARLVRLLHVQAQAKVLAPLITREIVYRLLLGERGDQLLSMADQGGDTHSIARAAELLGKNFAQPVRVEAIAKDLGMSLSSFHSHFKAVIGLSPLQFQKRLRLQEARRLMLIESLDAAAAGHQVGYDDAAHFSREYKNLFGAPPRRDVERLRAESRRSSSFSG